MTTSAPAPWTCLPHWRWRGPLPVRSAPRSTPSIGRWSFARFLITIDKTVPADLDVHLVCDNLATHKTPTVKKWLLAHPRFHIHFTPTASSWLNLVERWFAEITVKLIRRGVHHSVKQLAADITA